MINVEFDCEWFDLVLLLLRFASYFSSVFCFLLCLLFVQSQMLRFSSWIWGLVSLIFGLVPISRTLDRPFMELGVGHFILSWFWFVLYFNPHLFMCFGLIISGGFYYPLLYFVQTCIRPFPYSSSFHWPCILLFITISRFGILVVIVDDYDCRLLIVHCSRCKETHSFILFTLYWFSSVNFSFCSSLSVLMANLSLSLFCFL